MKFSADVLEKEDEIFRTEKHSYLISTKGQ